MAGFCGAQEGGGKGREGRVCGGGGGREKGRAGGGKGMGGGGVRRAAWGRGRAGAAVGARALGAGAGAEGRATHRDALDVVAEDLAVALGAALAQTLTTLAAARHFED